MNITRTLTDLMTTTSTGSDRSMTVHLGYTALYLDPATLDRVSNGNFTQENLLYYPSQASIGRETEHLPQGLMTRHQSEGVVDRAPARQVIRKVSLGHNGFTLRTNCLTGEVIWGQENPAHRVLRFKILYTQAEDFLRVDSSMEKERLTYDGTSLLVQKSSLAHTRCCCHGDAEARSAGFGLPVSGPASPNINHLRLGAQLVSADDSSRGLPPAGGREHNTQLIEQGDNQNVAHR
ncbi:hypothetical protein RRG08_035888 [Elysia crispata]|uniref:Uncharacterized protein n=1 Tax=Elysia crispata TaxID=231223 RepID=A0AAE1A228_9GAST|nr:hypothetical protein RRG08_035888 [Elysia crispata]